MPGPCRVRLTPRLTCSVARSPTRCAQACLRREAQGTSLLWKSSPPRQGGYTHNRSDLTSGARRADSRSPARRPASIPVLCLKFFSRCFARTTASCSSTLASPTTTRTRWGTAATTARTCTTRPRSTRTTTARATRAPWTSTGMVSAAPPSVDAFQVQSEGSADFHSVSVGCTQLHRHPNRWPDGPLSVTVEPVCLPAFSQGAVRGPPAPGPPSDSNSPLPPSWALALVSVPAPSLKHARPELPEPSSLLTTLRWGGSSAGVCLSLGHAHPGPISLCSSLQSSLGSTYPRAGTSDTVG